jgi:hypothetical protein
VRANLNRSRIKKYKGWGFPADFGQKDARNIIDYRPISLINSLVKIIIKILATRLAPHMNDLVSQVQAKVYPS